MKRFLIYISIAIAFALSSATEASAQVANTVPQPKFTIDTDIYDLRFATMPYFSYVYDDITQYAPAALVAGLKVFGYEGRTKWGGMIVSDVFSVGIMAGTVKGIKYIVNRQRPYGGDHSFPSGANAPWLAIRPARKPSRRQSETGMFGELVFQNRFHD